MGLRPANPECHSLGLCHEDCRCQGNRSVRTTGRRFPRHRERSSRRWVSISRSIEPGAGIKSGLPNSEFTGSGRHRQRGCAEGRRHHHQGEAARSQRACAVQARCAGDRDHGSLRQRGGAEDDRGFRRLGIRDGIDAAHHARAGHGRAVQPGQPRRLPRGDRGGRSLWPRLPDDDDDRGRHDSGRRKCS